MSDTVISVEHISKQYRLGEVGTGSLRHDFNRWWHKLRGKEDPYLTIGETNDRAVKGSSQYVWSLRDINFEVKRGEVLGIIGRNGAGKSTLLKILSRVTTPTTGEVKVKGRIASLLEVGTGFNPELTGRDNIYLNGAILGMRKREIDQKFDEIVDFSGVERYIDTPVKRYSSGMYVRLAFAVAAHLEPEILIVDEVLAVGDADFQKKCLAKMQDVAGHGRTIIFVSHNMDAIARLCTTAILLNKGGKEFEGATGLAVQKYLSKISQMGTPGNWMDLASRPRSRPKTQISFSAATYIGISPGPNLWPCSDRAVLFKLRISAEISKTVSSLAVVIFSPSQCKLVNADSLLMQKSIALKPGNNEVHLRIDRLSLKPGSYPVGLWLANSGEVYDWIESAFDIEVTNENDRLGSEIPDDGFVTCEFSLHQAADL